MGWTALKGLRLWSGAVQIAGQAQALCISPVWTLTSSALCDVSFEVLVVVVLFFYC